MTKNSLLTVVFIVAVPMVILYFLQAKNQELGTRKTSHLDASKSTFLSSSKRKIAPINPEIENDYKNVSRFDQDPLDVNDEEDITESESYFPATIVGELLTENMALTEELGPDAEDNYQKSLEQLRLNPEEAVTLLADAYEKIEEKKYLDRWKMVDTLATITTDHSLQTLSAIARSEVPEEQFPGVHGMNSKSEEIMIRRAAIHGIEALVDNGNPEAEEALLNLTRAKEKNIRQSAILAYIRTGSDTESRKTELKQELPEKDYWMLELKQLTEPPVFEINANSEPIKGVSVSPEGLP